LGGTNFIERLSKEFKRRAKPMEILVGERFCYTLLTFFCLKMEMTWRSKPSGKSAGKSALLEKAGTKQFHTKTLTVSFSW
jgi:putative transposase